MASTTAAPASDRKVTSKDNQPPSIADQMRAKHKSIFDRLAAWLPKAEKARKRGEPKSLKEVEALEALYLEGRDIRNDGDGIREVEAKTYFEPYKAINETFNLHVRDVVGSESGKAGLANTLKNLAAQKRLEITRAEQKRAADAAAELQARADEEAARAAATAGRGDVRIAGAQQAGAEALERQAGHLAAAASAPVHEASRSVVGGVSSSVNAKMVCTGVDRATLDLLALMPYLKTDVLIEAVNALLKATGERSFKGAVVVEQAVGSIRRA